MNVPPASIPFLQDATERRWWLLVKALECAPLDRAIELALQAEAFVCATIASRAEAPIGEREITAAEFSASPELALPTVGAAPATLPQARKSINGRLAPTLREQIVERLAQGASNAELAAEFAITGKQVQGVRMGCARRVEELRAVIAQKNSSVAKPRPVDRATLVAVTTPGSRSAAAGDPAAPLTASIDEVVRYLRQQNDVVVPVGSNEFLVNARFQLDFTKLVERANRMRQRQGKPEFVIGQDVQAGKPALAEANGRAIGTQSAAA